MDLTELLRRHGDDEPSGENLEYDPSFISLELAAQPGEERQIGDTVIAAEEPEWPEVITLALDVLNRSHDLRAAVFLANALLRTEGFGGFADATGYIRGVLEYFWDTCHPQLDPDDDNDPTFRINAVASLAGQDTIIRALRTTPLTDSRAFGRITLRDMMIVDGEIAMSEAGENAPDAARINAAFQDTKPDKLAATRANVSKALQDVQAVGVVFDERTPGNGPELTALERTLTSLLRRFDAMGVVGEGGAASPAAAPGGQAEGSDAGGAPAGGGVAAGFSAAPGAVNSQADVRATLDRLIGYYNRAEPSSPIPMLLERAKRLVGADFLTIINEMAPEGKDNVYLIGGLKNRDEDD
jgi:type VI secretion system protein ImpA